MNCLFFFVGLVTSVETLSDPMMGLTLFTSSGVSLRQPLAANFQSSESSLRTRKSLYPQNMGGLVEHRDIEEPVVISCSDWKDEQRYWPAALKQSTSGKYLQTSQHTFSPVRTWTLQRSQAEEIHCRWRICHLSPRAAPRQPLQHPRQDGE